jgi:hypothetical protein
MKITMQAIFLNRLIELDSFLEMPEKETDKEFTKRFEEISRKLLTIIISKLNHHYENKELKDKLFFASSLECLQFS